MGRKHAPRPPEILRKSGPQKDRSRYERRQRHDWLEEDAPGDGGEGDDADEIEAGGNDPLRDDQPPGAAGEDGAGGQT